MAYLGTLEAIRGRLEGQPDTFVPSFITPFDWDHIDPNREVGLNDATQVEEYLRRDVTANVGGQKVPIFYFGQEGSPWANLFPCFTYEIIGFNPRFVPGEANYDPKGYGAESYQIEFPGTKEDVNLDGTSPEGPTTRLVTRRLLEHPFDILFEIRAYSKDPIESAMMVAHIINIFPPRHFIRVPMADGSYRSWDCLFEDYRDLDRRRAVLSGSPGVEREYAKTWTFRVEGYLDNTATAEFRNLIRRRNMNLSLGT